MSETMTNWLEHVRARMPSLDLEPFEQEEIYIELAEHLQDCSVSLQTNGLPECEAVQRALANVPDWEDLRRKIFAARKKEHPMKKRLQQLWIPGFLTLILSVFSLMAAQTGGFQPPILWNGPVPILVYVPWLVTLPFFGALGAYLSSRAGGSRSAVLLSSVFPVLALTGAFLLMFPIDQIAKWSMGMKLDFGIVATTVLRDGIGWLLLPAVALLAGGVLSHFFFRPKSSSQNMIVA